MKPGTYDVTLYQGELEVATDSVTVTAGMTTNLALASAEPHPSVIFRIGDWDGTPLELLNGPNIKMMHPQDVRNAPWDMGTFTANVDPSASFPAIQFRGANSPSSIAFDLAPNQITDLTVRIGITCAYNGGRPQVAVNGTTASPSSPSASPQPSSRSFTIGTYRGNNFLYTYTVPASALVVGTNTMTINPISGSTDLGTWLSAGWAYDAVELDGPLAAPAITYVGGSPLEIRGTAGPSRNIALTLDGATAAGSTISAADGSWSITYNAAFTAGSHSFTAVASDSFGHSSPPSAAYAFDTSITMPVITEAVGDTGTYPDGATTSDRVFVFHGTAGPGDNVTITRIGMGNIGSVLADGSGDWTFDYTSVSLPDGVNRFYATATVGGSASASSPIFTLNLAGQPRVAIERLDPAFEVIPNSISQVVYRVTFNHTVNGVTTGAFDVAATDSAAGTVASISAASGESFDVTVNAIAGTGELKINLTDSNGITDGGGNPEGGYTAGEHYTLVVPTTGSGTWIRPEIGGRWSDALNWQAAVIADGASSSADFGTLDLIADSTVHLDSARTLHSLVFGDTDINTPASWILDNDGAPANTLTLVGPAPTITINELGSGATTTIGAALFGSDGLTKEGEGTVVLTAANPLTGALTVNHGAIQLPAGGELVLGNNPVDLQLNTNIDVTGGSFTTGGLVTAITSSFVVDDGAADLANFRTNSDFGASLRVNGGTLNVGDVNIGRNGGRTPDFGSGFVVTGGSTTAQTIGLGTKNSYGAMSIEGGTVVVTGPITIANQATGGRGGALRVLDGTFTASDAAFGILMCRNNGSNTNNVATAEFTGGMSTVEKFTLGFDSTVTAGSATINVNGGALYLGSGGIVKNGAAGLATNLNLSSGVVGAQADWSTSVPINLPNGGNVVFEAADVSGAMHDITLTGVLSGSGGFTKTGGGTLTLAAANTFTGPVDLEAGSLNITGSLANGGAVNLYGGMLTGTGAINTPVVLNGATIAPDGTTTLSLGGTSLTWNSGGRLAILIGADGVSGQVALSGALLKGTGGPFEINLTPVAGFAAGNTYTILTFGSTTFSVGDFFATGLPEGYVAFFSIDGLSLKVTVKALATVTLGDLTQPYDGTAKMPTATTDPTDLNVVFSYDGDITTPTLPGDYDVVAMIDDPVYTGSASGTFTITITALVRHAPSLNGDIDGSVQMLLGENVALNGGAGVYRDLLAPGTPQVVLNGTPDYGGTLDASGDVSPSNYTVTLNTSTLLRHVVRRVDAITLPEVAAPPVPPGTRDVTMNATGQSIGDFATLRNLTLNNNVGQIPVPPGTYGVFAANSGSGFTLGVAGASEPAIYNLQSLTLNSGASVQIVGPVILTLGTGLTINGAVVGNVDHPTWLTLQVASGGVTLNSGATLHGVVIAPDGAVVLNNGTLHGRLSANGLTINSHGLLTESQP